jgi:hypothetical protein
MKPENELKLLKRFPVLYRDYYSPMSQTCMCWGFSHDDGWFDIIWQLSLAIEDELNYWWIDKKRIMFSHKMSRKWNNLIYRISPVSHPKYKMEGTGKIGDPFHQVLVEPAKAQWDEKIVRFLFGQKQKIGKFEVDRIGLKGLTWQPKRAFSVDQVKEKFGTLRFYCPGNDRIRRYVRFAEALSARTCEICGGYGKLGHCGGWYSTRCEKCAKEQTREGWVACEKD